MPEATAERTPSVEALLEDLEPRFRLISRRYRIDSSDAEDALQNALLRYLRVQHSVRDPSSWLSLVFRRECLRILRWRKRHLEAAVDLETLEVPLLFPADHLHVERLDLAVALERLRPRHQRLLWWRYGLGMTEVEVAEALGCKRISAKKASSRALGLLRRAMSTARSDRLVSNS